MNPALLLAASVVVSGGVVCLAARESRVVLAGLAVTLLAAPFIADPLPDLLALAARIVAALLAVYLPWIVVRDRLPQTPGTTLGWPVDALIAAAAFMIGYGVAGLGGAAGGPAAAEAGGVGLIALSVAPIVFARDAFRVACAVAILIGGVLLVRVGLGGTPNALEQIVTAVLEVSLGAAIAFLLGSATSSSATSSTGRADDDNLPADRQPPEAHLARQTGR